MKKDIHPENFRNVIFHDVTSGERFLLGSTVKTSETDKWEDGKEYPLFRVEISSASHPFYTGQEMTMDTGGRVDKFKKRMAAAAPVKTKKAVVAEEVAETVETVVAETNEEVVAGETTEELKEEA